MKMNRISTPEIQNFETAHRAKVRTLTSECMVLLKNNGVLPIAKGGRIALYGGGARQTIKGGTGSGDVNVRSYVTVEEGLENAGFEVTTKSWLDAYDKVTMDNKIAYFQALRKEADAAGMPPMLYIMGKVAPEPAYDFPLDGEGDTAIYVLARISGEGSDRNPVAGDVNLTETEIRDINRLNEKYEKFILVLNTGGMVDLTPVEKVEAILIMGQLGSETGNSLADVLTGAAYPSGKLTMTWAPIQDYPSTTGFGDPQDTDYAEGIYVGYRYFDTADRTPTYPFGYGMGYTTFEVKPESADLADGQVIVKVLVTNTGSAAGKEVVQAYYSAPAGKIDKPYQELAAYAKTKELAAGESQEVTLAWAVTDMASYDTDRAAWVMEAGKYLIRVGNCSRNTEIAAVIELDGEVITSQLKNIIGKPGFEDMKPQAGGIAPAAGGISENGIAPVSENGIAPAFEKAAAPVIALRSADVAKEVIAYAPVMDEIPAGEPVQWEKVLAGEKTLDEFIGGLTDEQLSYLCIGDYIDSDDLMEVIGNASSTVAGAAGETTARLKDLGVGTLVMADGPAGLRLSKEYQVKDGVAKGGSSLAGDVMLAYTEEERKAMMSVSAGADNGPTYYQYCTAIPIGTAIAQSWNDELAGTFGDMVGFEMEQFNVQIWLAPALNIHRSPLCGRNFEYYSEDPVISGHIAAAITNGVQAHPGRTTTIKHFAFNNQETNRYFSSSNLSERAMREIYLKGFEIAVKTSQPHYLMTSYNLVNGVEHTCNSRDLNTSVLRDEWGYKGVVMTDWLVTGGMGPNGGKYSCASAAGCVKAGNDITMPGIPSDQRDIMAALADEKHPYHLTRAELQTCAKRVLAKYLELTTVC